MSPTAKGIIALLKICASLAPIASAAPETLSYSSDIRPLLSKNCFACHGPDDGKREAKTRLDVPDGADLDEVVARINSDDPDEVMPPPESNKALAPGDIRRLEQWIATGAPYEKHWAFISPERPPVTEGRHPIDHFVDRKLERHALARSPRADPYTRIRRVYLDLTGMPPSLEAADAFAADPSEATYLAIVDRLLASPRYGERWARRWLDLARYADTNGYEKDRDRSIWPYRDWVIRAINADMPFDQFTVEQLAGDMLPDATPEQMVATGFHRNTMLNEEGGIDPLEFRYHAMTDRVATTGTTWLGLTTGCAQCHTHKYDPITHHDYFGMMAYLNNADEPDYFLRGDNNLGSRREANLAKAGQLLADLPKHWPAEDDKTPPLEKALSTWLAKEKQNRADWRALSPESVSANVPYLTKEPDGVIVAAGDTSKHDIFTLEFGPHEQAITSIRLDALPDERLPGGGPGMTYYEGKKGDFFLSEFQLEDSSGTRLKISSASESYSKNGFGSGSVTAKHTIDDDLQSGWSIKNGEGRAHAAVFNLATPLPAGTAFKIRMHFGRHYASSLGKFRLSATASGNPLQASALPHLPADQLHKDNPVAREAFLLQSPQLAEQIAKIHELRLPIKGTSTLVMRERPPEHPRPTHLHHRGEYTQAKEQVAPRLPDAIWPADRTPPSDRLAFARWVVSRENPLTARVVANRQWAAFFGIGLVSTLDDFGMQGEMPSHPQLLDLLAVDLMDKAWSMKALHRLIVTSETYQQASRVLDPNTLSADRRLLRLFPRSRLEAEIIRDASLAASGLLDEKMFGPPVRPVQPSAAAANYKKSKWQPSKGSDRHRRSVYTYQKRTAPFAMFTTFDATSGEACVAKRDVSNTPLQALTLMNDPMFLEIARAYGKRIAGTDGDLKNKITAGFRWLLTRPPSADELTMLTEFHAKHANWTALARVLLSLDEAITKS